MDNTHHQKHVHFYAIENGICNLKQIIKIIFGRVFKIIVCNLMIIFSVIMQLGCLIRILGVGKLSIGKKQIPKLFLFEVGQYLFKYRHLCFLFLKQLR